MRWVVLVLLSGCSSVLGIDDFKVGDGGTGNEMGGDGGGFCLGPMGWRVCLQAQPSNELPISSSLNFSTQDSPLCAQVQPMSWKTDGQPDACFLIAANVTIGAPIVQVTGARPLVIFAADTISISTQLDVASHGTGANITSGPGAPSAACGTPMPAGNSTSSAAGGAGGSFMTRGGDGGNSSTGAVGGRAVAAATQPPMVLRAGCHGGVGGNSGAMGGRGGAGGGAVYLVAGNRITINGFINASGSGGQGGASTQAGGGGGGSGGMIHLHAPVIGGNGGVLVANGGGGGEGADGMNLPGSNGAEPQPQMPMMTPLGGNGQSIGGPGGNGFASMNATSGVAGPAGAVGAGGGGGGAGGFIRVNVAPTQITSSPSAAVIP